VRKAAVAVPGLIDLSANVVSVIDWHMEKHLRLQMEQMEKHLGPCSQDMLLRHYCCILTDWHTCLFSFLFL